VQVLILSVQVLILSAQGSILALSPPIPVQLQRLQLQRLQPRTSQRRGAIRDVGGDCVLQLGLLQRSSSNNTRFRLTAVLLTDETEAFEAASHGRRNGSSAARAWGLLKEAAERVFVSA